MVSILCLGSRLLPSKLVCNNNNNIVPLRRSQIHLSLSNTCYTLITQSPNIPLRKILNPVICKLEGSPPKPSGNDKDDNKIGRGMARASLVLACAIGFMSVSLRMSPKAIAGPRVLYQKAPPVAAGALSGKAALESLLEITVLLSSRELEAAKGTFRLPSRPSMEDVKAIKMHAVQLMKDGKAKEAEEFMQNAYNFYKSDSEPAYHVEMALVEILICLGKYKKALDCKCLTDGQRLHSDGRFPLYKAIIYTMLDDREEATAWWEEYTDFVERGFDPRYYR